MRILYHHRTLADGAEGVHIREMVNAFRELGHDVRLLGLGTPASGTPASGFLQQVRRRMPDSAYELASAACNVPEYLTVRKEILGFRPSFLYKRHARNDVAALRAARAHRVPSVLEVNCLFTDPSYCAFEPLTFGSLARSMERTALGSASAVVAVSSPLAARIGALIHLDAAITVLPNGANPAVFDPAVVDGGRIRSELGLDGVVVGWSGILREWHGLELLVSAVAAVPDVRLLIVGDGPVRSRIERTIREHSLDHRTTLVGRVPHAKMPEYIAAMDIAVVAEDRTRVASPMKLLEYMAMARVVVAPDLANIRDLVTPDVDGVVFEDGSSASLAGQLRRLAASPLLRERLGISARRTVEERRNWICNAAAVLALVARITSGSASGPRRGQSLSSL